MPQSKLPVNIIDFFSKYIEDNLGIVFKKNNLYQLEKRILKLQEQLGVTSVDEVYHCFKNNPPYKSVNLLLDLATNNETFFFRDKKIFELLKRDIVNKMSRSLRNESLKVWSCACSTGQEAYSIIFSLIEAGIDRTRIQVEGSDISSYALKRSNEGIYNKLEIYRGLTQEQISRFFTMVQDDSWQVKSDILNCAKFWQFNIVKDHYPINKYHIIFCRNVLIYHSKENRQKVIQNLYNSLKPGGILFLGTGESLIGIESNFKQINQSGMFYYIKE